MVWRPLKPMSEIANYIEAALWIVIGLVFAGFAARRSNRRRMRCLIASATFLLFGVSDIIEVRTGAWWRPWPLLALKAACICVMLVLLWAYFRERKPRPPAAG
jgi:hypothetical protein